MSNHRFINYNLAYANSSDTTKVAQFDITKDLPILSKPQDYSFIIQKLTVSTRAIPRMYSYILPYGPSNSSGNPNATLNTVYLSYGTNFYRTVVQHVPEGNYLQPPNLSAQNQFQDLTNFSKYYSINSIAHFLGMLNTALQTSMTALIAANHSFSGVPAPYFELDNQTGLITLYAPYPQFSPSAGTPIYVYCNFRLRSLMKNFSYYDLNNGVFRFNFVDPSGTPTQTICQQETAQLNSFSSAMTELVVKSDSFQVLRTYEDVPNDVGENVIGNNNLNLVNTQGYINSFSILDNPSGNYNRVAVSYVPTGQYRKLSFTSSQPINRVNISIWYKDAYQNEFPLILDPSDYVNILILFEKLDETQRNIYN